MLIHWVSEKLQGALQQAFPDLQHAVEVTLATQESFGHYQCNSAMKLVKELKRNPREIATLIVENLSKDGFSKVEIAGPGFINLTLTNEVIQRELQVMGQDRHLGVLQTMKGKKVIVDYSSPNVAKEMHVGHLRSTIIGEAISRVFEFMGASVLRLNHIGDWGTSFGMLITYLLDNHPEIVHQSDEIDLSLLTQWYKESKKRFDADADFKERSQKAVVALQGGDPLLLSVWKKICEISRRAYEEVYDLLQVKLIERGESFYNPYLARVVQDLEDKNLITISDGAKCVFMEEFKGRDDELIPLMVQKSDGGYNYDTTDMAAVWHRVHEEKASRIVILTDAGQSLHFALVFKAAELVGYYDPKQVRMEHVPFGLVVGQDGKKLRTRAGEAEKLVDLLKEAVEIAKALLAERDRDLPEDELKKIARVLGIGAVKYADLSCSRTSDYTFSYERMLRFDGNTAAFVMYSLVRSESILRKCKEQASLESLALAHPSEISLGFHLLQFPDVVAKVGDDLFPSRLTDYLYLLAEKFNAFFRDCRVEGSQEEKSRLMLTKLTQQALKVGLTLLGIEAPHRM